MRTSLRIKLLIYVVAALCLSWASLMLAIHRKNSFSKDGSQSLPQDKHLKNTLTHMIAMPTNTPDDTMVIRSKVGPNSRSLIENRDIEQIIKSAAKKDDSREMIVPPKIYYAINVLHSESTSASLVNFYQTTFFMFPGLPIEMTGVASGIPLHKSVGRVDIGHIYSNRRFLKLYDELSALSPAEAGRLVAQQLENQLPVYIQLFDKKHKEVMETKSYSTSFEINKPNKDPEICGSRLSILGLVLIAGNLHLKESHKIIADIVQIGVKQRDVLYQSAPSDKSLGGVTLYNAGLYNRQILITGLLGTTAEGLNAKNQIIERHGLKLDAMLLTKSSRISFISRFFCRKTNCSLRFEHGRPYFQYFFGRSILIGRR